MPQVKTGVKCVVCKEAEIVAEVESVASREDMPVGPISKDYFDHEVTFHCSGENCAVLYYHPPGQPNAATEILASFRKDDEAYDLYDSITRIIR